MKKYLILLMMYFSIYPAIAASVVTAQDKIIAGSTDKNYYQFNSNRVLLNTQAPKNSLQLFFIHNISNESIWLDKANKKGMGMQAGWASQLDGGKWSALLLAGNQASFQLSCSNTDMKSVDCSKYMAVSHANSVTYGAAVTHSSYWATENQSSDNLLAALKKRQIIIQVKA